jgi:hypothetical protein
MPGGCKVFGVLLPGEAVLRIGFPVHVERELYERAKALLAVAQTLFSLLAFAQIQHERDARPLVERGRADQHRHPAAVLAVVLLLEGDYSPGRLQFCLRERGALAPFGRRQVGPAHPAGDEILPVVSHHLEVGLIGLDDVTLAGEDEDPDDIGVDQAPDPRFPFLKFAVQPAVLE